MDDSTQDAVSAQSQDAGVVATTDAADDDLKAQNDALKLELENLNNQYLRLAADFENFRKRQAQERESLLKYGAQNTLEPLLPALDNLLLAQKSLSISSDPAMLFKSFEMLSTQLLDALRSVGLERMTPEGQPFDPNLHEAVSQVERTDMPEHTVVDVYKAGYMIHDRVLRHAQVVVATQPNQAEESAAAPATNTAGFDPASTDKPNPFKGQAST